MRIVYSNEEQNLCVDDFSSGTVFKTYDNTIWMAIKPVNGESGVKYNAVNLSTGEVDRIPKGTPAITILPDAELII